MFCRFSDWRRMIRAEDKWREAALRKTSLRGAKVPEGDMLLGAGTSTVGVLSLGKPKTHLWKH